MKWLVLGAGITKAFKTLKAARQYIDDLEMILDPRVPVIIKKIK